MVAEVIDGTAVAAAIRDELRNQVEILSQDGIVPRIAVVLVGDDPASRSYVTAKRRAAEEIGLLADIHEVGGEGEPTALTEELHGLIERLNADVTVDGIILQLPVPAGVDEDRLLRAIDPLKDVDGLHPENQGRLLQGQARYYPATPHGVQQMLVRSGNDPGHQHVVIVGRSTLVGRPLAAMLMQKRAGANATVTVCHTGTRDISEFTRQADIVVVAAGRPNTLTADMIREGAVVVDVGVNRVDDATRKRGYRLVGDVDFEAVKEKASFITPVPGGVGPMTVTMLLANVVRSAQQFRRR
jgi:methylenetetrahydrofolate dehydrogenase (NADP+)/methenyltetrahydrofolate cyclohydrolase